MKIAVEISYYPFIVDYKANIRRFIKKLKTYNSIKVRTNSISTQITGDYDQVMAILTFEMKAIFSEEELSVLVFKFLNKEIDLEYVY